MRSNIRDIKLDILLGNPNEIVDEFIRITDGIQIMNCSVCRRDEQEFIWYVDDRWIFYQDLKKEYFLCNYTNYWSIFKSKFGLKYSDIQSITKFMVETAFKDVVEPFHNRFVQIPEIETSLKNNLKKNGYTNF